MSWHLLEKSLDEVSKQSTIFGKLWITFLFVFRVIAVTRMGDTIYADEQAAFRCNIKQIGCENVCFNEFSPISHVRFWGFQIIIVATPALMFLVYTTHAVSCIPSAKLIRRKMEFLRSQKQSKTRISKNTSKTTQTSGKNTISTNAQSYRQRPNLLPSAWIKQKHELVRKWKTIPNPILAQENTNVKEKVPTRKKNPDEVLCPPAYQGNNTDLFFEEVWMENVCETERSGKEEFEQRCGHKKQFTSRDKSESKFSQSDCLFKEVSVNRLRRHSDGDLNCLKTLSQAAQLLQVAPSSQVSSASRSPPHYSVIHLSQLTDVTASNHLVSASNERLRQRTIEVVSTDTCAESASKQVDSLLQSTNYQNFITDRHREETKKLKDNKLESNCTNATQRSEIFCRRKDVAEPTTSFERSHSGYVKFARKIVSIERKIAIVYFFQCICRLALESVFLYAQYRLFQFNVPELFKCRRWPCPNTVDCYVSRPEEKSVMLYFMFYLTAGCILLAFCEATTLIFRYIRDWIQTQKIQEILDEVSIENGKKHNGQVQSKRKSRNYNISKHPYLLEGYNKLLRMHSIDEYDETTSEDSKSTKSSNSESETEDAQANTFNSQDLESMFENDLGPEAGELNNEDNEAGGLFV